MNKERTMQTGGVGKRIAKEYKTELSMLAIFVVFFAVLSFASPYFLTTKNIMNVMSQVSSTALMAIGMTLVIITSGIDLSVGSTLGLSGMVGCMILMNTQNIILGVLAMILIGVLVGLVNGILVGYLQLPAFIVTLGTMKICRSLDYVISNASTASKFPEVYSFLGKGKVGGAFPVYIIFIFAMFAIFIWVMGKTKFLRPDVRPGSVDHDQPPDGLRRHLWRRRRDGCNRSGCYRRHEHERRQGNPVGYRHRRVPGRLPPQCAEHSGREPLLAGDCNRRGHRDRRSGRKALEAQGEKIQVNAPMFS